MISNFDIAGFRLFKKLKIENLGRLNLIVGKNNSGKSALLEALGLHLSNFSHDLISDILAIRQEDWALSTTDGAGLNSPLRHLFNSHSLPELNQDGITFCSDQFGESKLMLCAFAIERDADSMTMRRRLLKAEELELIDNSDDITFGLMVNRGEDYTILTTVEENSKGLAATLARRRFTEQKLLMPYQFLPTKGLSSVRVAKLWDSIVLSELEQDVLVGLQLIEPRVTDLTFIGDNNGRYENQGRIPLVKINGEPEPISLKSLGDGMTRIFHLILTLVCAKNGVLLVDEVENGLHWSVQPRLWQILFELAQRLNVQVFATTHSRDSISAFQQTWANSEQQAALIRIVNKNGEIQAQTYSLELLADSLNTDVEVR